MPKTDTNELELGVTIRGVAAEQKLFGRYTLRKVLGRGGMGIVWLAHDDELKRNVAMKFLPDMIIRDREAVEDLKRETRRSLDLTHHHIVRIYDFTQDDTCAAIVMEYVDGDSLSALKTHQTTGCFSVSALQVWAGHFCQALDYAHRQARVVHRDLKPANLMVNSRGDLKVTDFGISRSMSDSMTRVSISNSAGTLAYMSPEQALGAPPAVGDDIYAFGATIYDLLTGRPPFFRGNLQVQLETVIPPAMEARRAELGNSGEPIPALWEEVIAACLAKRPQDRPRSMAEIANLLGVAGSSSSGTGVAHGGFGGGIPGTSRTSFAPGTSTTDRTISPEEMITAQVRIKPSTPGTPRTATSGTPPVPTRAEDVFVNVAPARTPTAPSAKAPQPSSVTAPQMEAPAQSTPTNRTAPTVPAPVERVIPAPPVEQMESAAPIAAAEVPPIAEHEFEVPPAAPEAAVPEASAAAEPVVEEPIAAPVIEKIAEPASIKPAAAAPAPQVAESELAAEPMTMPAVGRRTDPQPPAAGVEDERASAEAAPAIQRPAISEPPKPFPAAGTPPYQGLGQRVGTPRKKSAAPLIAAAVGAVILFGGLAAWYANRDPKSGATGEVSPPQPSPVVAPPAPTESETLTTQAAELRAAGKLQEAKLALSRALALDPENKTASALEAQVDEGLAQEKMKADLEAKTNVLSRVDAALQSSDFLNAKRLIETVPAAHANDPEVVAKQGEIAAQEANAAKLAAEKKAAEDRQMAAEKKAAEDRQMAADKAAAEAVEKKTANAEKEEEETRPVPVVRKKPQDDNRSKTKTTSSRKKETQTSRPPQVAQTPVVRPPAPVTRPLPTPAPKRRRSGPSGSTIF